MNSRPRKIWTVLAFGLAIVAMASGCQTAGNYAHFQQIPAEVAADYTPRELDKVSLPPYIIEPPDVLLIEAVKIVPKPPYKIENLDVLTVLVRGTLPDAPIA
jgi:polysaccharide export outer membrane protein